MEFLAPLAVEPAVLAAFILAVGAVVLSPGPDTIMIIRYTMNFGTAVDMTTMGGVQAGLLTHTLLAILGSSVVIASSAILFNGIAITGALYLAWLGIQGFRDGGLDFESGVGVITGSDGKATRDALLSNVLNPKVILLCLALMPNFLDLEKGNTAAQLAELGMVLILINIIWQVGLVLLANRARAWLGTPRVQVWVSCITSGVLIFFAAAMIWTNVV